MQRSPDREGSSGSTVTEASERDWPAIGAKVRELRVSGGHGGTRTFAAKLGLSRRWIKDLEDGKLVPPVEKAQIVAAALGVPPEEIFGEPSICACNNDDCTELTYARFAQGHNPKATGPVDHSDEIDDEMGKRMHQARIAMGWTLDDLSKELGGTDESYLSSLENGSRRPGVELARDIHEVLGVTCFEIGTCPCRPDCTAETVDGEYAHGHTPLSPESREKLSDKKSQWWADRRARGDRSGTKPRLGEFRTCRHCERSFYVTAARLRKNEGEFCSTRCSTSFRIHKTLERFPFMSVSPKAIKRWDGTKKLTEVRHRKGAEEAEKVGKAAIAFVQRYSNARSADLRRFVIEALMREFEGRLALENNDGTPRTRSDAVYRLHRERIMVRLRRAYRDLGEPPEIEVLLKSRS